MGIASANMSEPVVDRVTRRAVTGRRIESGPQHEHADFELTWVEAGHVEFDLGGRRSLAAAMGACIVLPPEVEVTPRVRVAVLHQIMIPGRAVEAAAAALGCQTPARDAPLVVGADDRLAQLIRLFMQEAAAGLAMSDPLVGSLSDAVIYGLLRAAPGGSTPAGARDRRVRRAIEAMEAGYRDSLSIDDLAAAAGMSRFAFLHAFRAQTGTSPYQYLTGIRLERAAERLRAAGAPSVLEIALGCGFTDPSRFARAFRARHGCSPRAYRARHRG